MRARIPWGNHCSMQAFVASLTAAMLLLHAVLGCCWHHAHRCEHRLASAQPADCCHHLPQDGDGQPENNPHSCPGECEGSCVYVVPGKVQIEAPQWTSIDFLAVLPLLADEPWEAATSWEAACSVPDFAPPLRRHLLHQVLLN